MKEMKRMWEDCNRCGYDFNPYGFGDDFKCNECYEKALEIEYQLNSDISDLCSKATFLTLLSPAADPTLYAPSKSSVTLLPYGYDDTDSSSSGPPLLAHKDVLASRSPVFKAMLQNDMEESRSGIIKIADVSYDVLCAFVNYLYTADACHDDQMFSLDDQMASDLLVLADKYEVKYLKEYCEEYFIDDLTWKKAIVKYAFAHQHNAKKLLNKASALITKNMDKVRKSKAYAHLKKTKPRLVVDILEAVVDKQSESQFNDLHNDSDYYSDDYDDDDDDDDGTRRRHSCKDYFKSEESEGGVCRVCYDEAIEAEGMLKRQIERLKSKVNFLKLLSPVDPTVSFNPCALPNTDVTIILDGDSSVGPIHAHKAVLVSRSPVFKAMLGKDMEESQSGTINVADISYDTLRAFINYLYIVEVRLDEQMAFDLLAVAEKYQVKHLKEYCEKFLIPRLNKENAIAYFAFARQNNAEKLLDLALTLITDNMDCFITRKDYKDLKVSNPRIVEVISQAVRAKQVETAFPIMIRGRARRVVRRQ